VYSAKAKNFNNTLSICAIHKIGKRPSIFITDRPNFSSERILNKDYDGKGSVAKKKISGRESQGARSQDELIGGKPPVVK
jgi:hypothetical protein